MSTPIQNMSGPNPVANERPAGREVVRDKIVVESIYPNYFELVGMSDDLSMQMPLLKLLATHKTASQEINTKVELDIEGNASSLVQEVLPVTRASDLLLMLRQRFSDITDIWLILQAMIKNYSYWKLDRLLLQETMDLLEAESDEAERQAMWAGVNTNALTQQYARMTNFTPRQLRRWYRVWLTWDIEDEDGFFWAMTEEVEPDCLGTLFHYIARALRHDINALRPSTQPDRLSMLLNKISAMTRFTTLVQRICGLCPIGQPGAGQPDSPLAGPVAHFLRTILTEPVVFLPQWIRLREHESLADIAHQMCFLRELRKVLVELPDLFFKERSDRARLDAKVVQEISERWQGQDTGQHDVEC
ncbi:HrpJ domain-containing protein [Pantoea cypripedii]|uniref:HrpJ domain-containing protein n=1 Tax=Pantoea cypripedii TaxID=55209 RepID=UPI002FC8791A